MSKVIIPEGIDMRTLALSIFEALNDEELEIFIQELNALIIRKKSKTTESCID